MTEQRGKVGKRRRHQDRKAWTEFVEGKPSGAPKQKRPKYSNQRTADGFASKREARVGRDLRALAQAGKITEYEEQKRFVLVAGDGQVRGVTYIADFVYRDETGLHVLDAKGFQTTVYKLKKRMMWLLLKIKIEEV